MTIWVKNLNEAKIIAKFKFKELFLIKIKNFDFMKSSEDVEEDDEDDDGLANHNKFFVSNRI